ncbi:MAG: hypothetical protein JSS09_03115 [Verrucomicrobia bacterium]|nr:hypothetical protein [Verrucomicrobiota bacterium]
MTINSQNIIFPTSREEPKIHELDIVIPELDPEFVKQLMKLPPTVTPSKSNSPFINNSIRTLSADPLRQTLSPDPARQTPSPFFPLMFRRCLTPNSK